MNNSGLACFFLSVIAVILLAGIIYTLCSKKKRESYEMGEKKTGYFYNLNKAYDFNIDYNKNPVQSGCGCRGTMM